MRFGVWEFFLMETPVQTCSRLLAALEDLARQEATTLAARDFATVVKLQERGAPLVAHLAEHGPAVADAALRARIAAWLAHRHKTGEWLAAQIAQTKAELENLDARQRQVARLAPAYGRAAAASRQLSAVG